MIESAIILMVLHLYFHHPEIEYYETTKNVTKKVPILIQKRSKQNAQKEH